MYQINRLELQAAARALRIISLCQAFTAETDRLPSLDERMRTRIFKMDRMLKPAQEDWQAQRHTQFPMNPNKRDQMLFK